MQLHPPRPRAGRRGRFDRLTVVPRLGAGVCAAVVLGVVAVVLGVVLAASWARAPDQVAVTSTSPADRATLVQAPSEVELAFTAPVDLGLSHVSVRDGSGTAVSVGQPSLVTPERLRQPVNITAVGDVRVAYHVTFVDGAELTGTLRFSVRVASTAGPDAASGPSAAASPTHEHGEVDPVSAVLLVLDGIVALTAVVLLIRRPQPRAAGQSRQRPATAPARRRKPDLEDRMDERSVHLLDLDKLELIERVQH